MRAMLAVLTLLGLLFACADRGAAQQETYSCIQVISPTGQNNCVAGWAPKLLNGLTSTVTQVKGSAGLLGTVYCYNGTGSVAYLQLFDAATTAAVTVGTTTPKLSFGIPSALASGTGPTAVGVQFLNGIEVASTTTATGSSSATMDCNVTFN